MGNSLSTRRGFLGAAAAGAGGLALAPRAALGARPAALDVAALDRAARSRYAFNGGVRLHYKIAGSGPLVLFVHGFPGWWGLWRHAMAALADRFTVAAMDMRAYNLSDKPLDPAAYGMGNLIGDIRAVIEHSGRRRATVVGHDWGGAAAWLLATTMPEFVERLVVVNIPHPWALARELHDNPEQQRMSRYAQELRRPDAISRRFPQQLGGGPFAAEALARLLARPGSADHARHVVAMRRSSLWGAASYYRETWAAEPYPAPPPPPVGTVRTPTLVIWGREDDAFAESCLDGTSRIIAAPLRTEHVDGAGHFVMNDARERFNRALRSWLLA
jgi:epoxide hydrolase 4